MKHKIVRFADLKPGMVVLPFKGVFYQIKDEDLDWGWTLATPFWQHLVIGFRDDGMVILSRPYAYASETASTPLLAAETYAVNNPSVPYLVLDEGRVR